MPEYRAIYKCRLCGEEFETHIFRDSFEAEFYIAHMAMQFKRHPLPYEHHICKNEDVGFADFIGCRKVED